MTFINTTTNSTTIGQLLGVEPLVECLAPPPRLTRALTSEEAWMRMVTPTASKTTCPPWPSTAVAREFRQVEGERGA